MAVHRPNMSAVHRNARRMGIPPRDVRVSKRKTKKIEVRDPAGRWVAAGHTGYADFTEHRDRRRRTNYLKRARGMPHPKWSPNWVAINLLWQ